MNSQDTVLDLRKRIAKEAKTNWTKMNIKTFQSNACISFNQNSYTLEQSNLKNGESILVQKNFHSSIQKVPLLKNGEMVPRLQKVLDFLFVKYS